MVRLVITGGLVFMGWLAYKALTVEKPPVGRVEGVRSLLSRADSAEAPFYCPSLYAEAETVYEEAMTAWKTENRRWFPLRKYRKVDSLAAIAEKRAKEAIHKAADARKSARTTLRKQIDTLRGEMKGFEPLFAGLPLDTATRGRHSRGKMLLNAAEIAFEKGDYAAGNAKGEEAVKLIEGAYGTAHGMLERYFEKLPEWRTQVAEAIAYSKKNRAYVVVVEKMPARCRLYYKGREQRAFHVEFGRNWIGDKRYEGDYATPEGAYRVVKRMQGAKTRYHKALLLDYPNEADRKRFQTDKKRGVLPQRARIGGMIELHGGGGKKANWTEGCVAFEDKDIDVLFKAVKEGTKVVIVGSTEELDIILKNNGNN